MESSELLRLACETNHAYLALGNQRFEAHGASFLTNRKTPRRHDSNCVGLIRTGSQDEAEALIERTEEEYGAYKHRCWHIDALTPPETAARIALEPGVRLDETLVLMLEGELRLRGSDSAQIEVREVLSEDDWLAYRELDALWWKESSIAHFGEYDPELHEELTLSRRLKAPQARAWFACVGGVPRAFFSSWPGDNGVGIVEDLFCHADFRHRGLATALLARCVTDCRERGAGPVIINADTRDTPKQMYAAMGFRPLFIHRTYTRRLDETGNASR